MQYGRGYMHRYRYKCVHRHGHMPRYGHKHRCRYGHLHRYIHRHRYQHTGTGAGCHLPRLQV